ncbi:MAG TPA: hypothetical protein VGG73_00965 [Vicinamibacterales bacterium]|jgi:hypothetical protein
MSEKRTFWLIFFLSIAASIGGLFVCKATGKEADAIRGGSLGAAIALGFMFATRDYGNKLYKARTSELSQLRSDVATLKTSHEDPAAKATLGDQVSKISIQVNALVASMDIDVKGRETENKFLALATCIGTLVGGFGDLIAKQFLL